ncbi:unnamed protein product, partial [Trichobilharzia regenti]
ANLEDSSSIAEENKNESKDNRNIKCSQGNQKLSGSHIEQLQQIVEGSTTFEQKTSFSQQKYLKKKKTKHLSLFSIEKPNTRIIFETYGSLRPEKCLHGAFDNDFTQT